MPRGAATLFDDARFLAEADWYDLAGDSMTSEKWEAAETAGFEVRIREADGYTLVFQIDRPARRSLDPTHQGKLIGGPYIGTATAGASATHDQKWPEPHKDICRDLAARQRSRTRN